MKPPGTQNGVKKDLEAEAGGGGSHNVEPSPVTDADDYPAGATLAFIVVALAMSMFLVALDMVGKPTVEQTCVSPFLFEAFGE